MKRISILALIALSVLTLSLPAQTDIPRWRLGAGAGINSLRVNKGGGSFDWILISNDEKVTIQRKGSRIGFQANGAVSYYLSRHWRLQGGAGVAYAHAFAYRKEVNKGTLFGIPFTSTFRDTISQKYVLLELPVFFRWHLSPVETRTENVKLFFDMGLILQPPLLNHSTFQRGSDEKVYSSGDIDLDNSLRFCLGVGLLLNKNYALTLSWTGISSDMQNFYTTSTLTRLTLTRYFDFPK